MAIRFITDYPALFITEKKILVISDLHIGLEHELYKAGITIPSQGDKFRRHIEKLVVMTHAKMLVILGDLKHKVPGSTLREDKEIIKFFDALKDKVKIVLLKGNHDDRIEGITPDGVKIFSSRGFKVGKYGFFHGHAWPTKDLMQCDYLFMGHVHPAIEFRDDFGFRAIEQVWVKGKLDKKIMEKKYKTKKTGKMQIVVVPAFNRLLGGLALNRKVEDDYIGPVLTKDVLEDAEIYLLDGTRLGEMKHLKTL